MVGKIAIALFASLLLKPVNAQTNNAELRNAKQNPTTHENFVYSAKFVASSTEKGFVFGESSNQFKVLAAFNEDKVKLVEKDEVIMSINYNFTINNSYKLDLVVNEDVVRLYVNDNTSSIITCKLDNYNDAGTPIVSGTCTEEEFFFTDLYEDSFYCKDYQVTKIINITDNFYKLKTNEFSLQDGKLTIA